MSAPSSKMRSLAKRATEKRPWTHRPDRGDRVRAPVRSQSKFPNDPVAKGFSRRPCYRETDFASKALDAYRIASRVVQRERTGQSLQGGDLQPTDLLVYGYLAGLARNNDETFPTVETIAEKTGRSSAAVHEAKSRLRAVGVIDWLHRAIEVDEADQPPVRQISNLYRLNELPEPVLVAAPKAIRDGYRNAVAASNKQAQVRLKSRNASAADLERKMRSRPRSDTFTRMIKDSLSACAPAQGGLPDSS